ncbi:MAG TPA: hypothetical protein V6C72_01090 [Chroococcales cyanobacterium]
MKGSRAKNQYGVAEWRVWPTKEMVETLGKIQGAPVSEAASYSQTDFEPIEAEEISYEFPDGTSEVPSNWRDVEMARMEVLAEKFVKPLADRIEAQAIALADQERLIAEQKRQLRLLPDLEKQAESERKAAELKELEAEALRKQIAALKADQVENEQSKLRITELEKAIADTQRQAEEELEKLKAEKESQVSAVQEQLQQLSSTVQELKRPWWKKMFGAAPSNEA